MAALLNQPDYVERAYEYGDKQGKALASAGVNLNFSPVVDLKPITKPSKLDFHSHIATRAISTDPEQVIEVATPYIRGLRQQGVLATLKHFPGLAHVVNDTHHFSAFLEKPIKELEEGDFLPFLRISRGTDVWIMLSHVILVNVDATKPVSTSRQVIDILIRQQLGINNALITDDLTMGATYNRGFCKSVRQSYETSVNYLLIAYDYEKYYSAVSCLSKSFGREK